MTSLRGAAVAWSDDESANELLTLGESSRAYMHTCTIDVRIPKTSVYDVRSDSAKTQL